MTIIILEGIRNVEDEDENDNVLRQEKGSPAPSPFVDKGNDVNDIIANGTTTNAAGTKKKKKKEGSGKVVLLSSVPLEKEHIIGIVV